MTIRFSDASSIQEIKKINQSIYCFRYSTPLSSPNSELRVKICARFSEALSDRKNFTTGYTTHEALTVHEAFILSQLVNF